MTRALKKNVSIIFNLLETLYPNLTTFLDHNSTFELLVATVLSAQCTDERVNQVTPALFEAFPTPMAMAMATPELIVTPIRRVSFCYAKATHLHRLATRLISHYNGEVPDRLEDLVTLPGVGRKTANVVLGQAFGQPGITVDTHVKRLSKRLGWTMHHDAVLIERDLMALWPKSFWTPFSSTLIVHGRKVCHARKPACTICLISDYCPSKQVG